MPHAVESQIRERIVRYVAQLLEVPETEIDVEASLEEFGVDSEDAAALTGDLEEWLEIAVDPTLPYEYSTIQALAARIARDVGVETVG